MIPTKKKTAALQSVQKGLRILKLFTIEKSVWGLTEIANTLLLSKSTASRLGYRPSDAPRHVENCRMIECVSKFKGTKGKVLYPNGFN